MRTILLASAALLIATGADAAERHDSAFTGHDVMDICAGPQATDEMCGAFLMGTVNALQATGFLCLPDGWVSISGMKGVAATAARYLRDNPDRRGSEATALIYRALSPDYGCGEPS